MKGCLWEMRVSRSCWWVELLSSSWKVLISLMKYWVAMLLLWWIIWSPSEALILYYLERRMGGERI